MGVWGESLGSPQSAVKRLRAMFARQRRLQVPYLALCHVDAIFSEYGTYKTVTARFWPCLSGESPHALKVFPLRSDAEWRVWSRVLTWMPTTGYEPLRSEAVADSLPPGSLRGIQYPGPQAANTCALLDVGGRHGPDGNAIVFIYYFHIPISCFVSSPGRGAAVTVFSRAGSKTRRRSLAHSLTLSLLLSHSLTLTLSLSHSYSLTLSLCVPPSLPPSHPLPLSPSLPLSLSPSLPLSLSPSLLLSLENGRPTGYLARTGVPRLRNIPPG